MKHSTIRPTIIATLLFFAVIQIPCKAAFVSTSVFEKKQRYENGKKLLEALENLKNSTNEQEKQAYREEALRLLKLPEGHVYVDLENWEIGLTTPLNLSLITGETEIVQEILHHKDSTQNFNLHLPVLINAFEIACKHGFDNLVVMTIQHMSQEEKDYSLSYSAINNNSPKIIKLLLAGDADPNTLYDNSDYIIQYIIKIFDDRIYHLLDGDPKSYLACRENLGLLIAAKGFLADEEIEALGKAPHQEIRDIVLRALYDLQKRRLDMVENVYQLTPQKCPKDLSAIISDYTVADGNEIEKTIKKIELMRTFSGFDRRIKEVIASFEGSAIATQPSSCTIL